MLVFVNELGHFIWNPVMGFPFLCVVLELNCLTLQLLAEDPALKRFKSHKKSVNAVKRMGDVLTLVVVAGKRFKIFKYF